MQKLIQYRQGDVLIERVPAKPQICRRKIARENGRVVLAHGEVTGHAHAIKKPNAALFRDPKLAAIFLQVAGDGPALLEHEEHTTIPLSPAITRSSGSANTAPTPFVR
jgi:hypothetical protein